LKRPRSGGLNGFRELGGFAKQQKRLMKQSKSFCGPQQLRRAAGVSESYASRVRSGKRGPLVPK
jgi:hypothetical protein